MKPKHPPITQEMLNAGTAAHNAEVYRNETRAAATILWECLPDYEREAIQTAAEANGVDLAVWIIATVVESAGL
jgi:hypothetical protein